MDDVEVLMTPELIMLVPLVVAVLGAIIYVLAAKPEAKELGRISFAVGLLWLVFQYSHQVVKL